MQIPMSELLKTLPQEQDILLSSCDWNYEFRANDKHAMKEHGELIFDTNRDVMSSLEDRNRIKIWFDFKDKKDE